MTLEFRVFGVAVPKGNMRAFTPRGMKFPIITESNRNVKSWSQLVAEGANHALAALPLEDRGVLQDGVRLIVGFYLPRPKYLAKQGSRPAHLKAPDLDKLARCVLDSLTGVVWRDDSQVIELVARKDYAALEDSPHVDVRVEPAFGGTTITVPKASVGSVLPLFEASR